MHIIISIPAANTELYSDLKTELAKVGTLATTPPRRDLDTIKLVIEIGASTLTFINGLLSVLDKYRQLKKPLNGMFITSRGDISELSSVDEALLNKLLNGTGSLNNDS